MAEIETQDELEFFERRIVIGMVVSTDYLGRIHRLWKPSLLSSPELKTVAEWCIEYFREFGEAPDRNIEALYMERLQRSQLSKTEAEYIALLLESLSDEYGREGLFNSAYLYDRTIQHLKAMELEQHSEQVQELIEAGEIAEAERLARTYVPTILSEEDTGIDLASEQALERVERAFTETFQQVLSYPGALGEMWNEHLVRGGFFTLLAPEKRGKSFFLLEMALRAIRQKANVAFFEAGDMTESQVLRRICVYIAQRSDRERYCQERFRAVGDCVLNQLDLCTRADRNCDCGIFDGGLDVSTYYKSLDQLVTLETLSRKYEEFPDYAPCDSYVCDKRRPTVWLERVPETRPLTANMAKREIRKFFRRWKRRFRLITYPAGTLTVSEVKARLDEWERYDGFVPDVIAIDYADLLSADDSRISEFRHRQDFVWKSLRALSQERHALVITATQADAESYRKGRLSISNFSEDKRKLSHVTAQYGLNQDPFGREKKLGIMRINEIVVREGAFSSDNEVYVLQDLAIGRPFLGSFAAR